MKYEIRFPAPTRHLTLNQRLHHHERAAISREWRTAAYYAAVQRLGRTPEARSKRHCTVTVYIPMNVRRRRDPHNFVPTLKPIIDGLVDAGVWPDDTPEWVTTTEPHLPITATDVVVVLDESPAPDADPHLDDQVRATGLAGIAAARAALHAEGGAS